MNPITRRSFLKTGLAAGAIAATGIPSLVAAKRNYEHSLEETVRQRTNELRGLNENLNQMLEALYQNYRATLRANFPVDHLELIWNRAVVARLDGGTDRRAADVTGSFDVTASGWLVLRAWNDGPHPEVLDIYPYATTSPVYVKLAGRVRRSRDAATYFLHWLDRIQAAVANVHAGAGEVTW